MRKLTATAALTVALWGACPLGVAQAQEPPPPTRTSQDKPQRFVGLDAYVGYLAVGDEEFPPPPGSEEESGKSIGTGWEVGGTISVGVRWVGATATVGRISTLGSASTQILVGPRVTTPWMVWGEVGGRLFAHALVGHVGSSGFAPPDGGLQWVVGGGFDLLLLRIQIDYVRLNLAGFPKNNGRAFVGGIVPLCLRGCRESDGFNVSGRPTTK